MCPSNLTVLSAKFHIKLIGLDFSVVLSFPDGTRQVWNDRHRQWNACFDAVLLNYKLFSGGSGVQLDTSPIARGYRKLFRVIRIFAFVARLAIRKD